MSFLTAASLVVLGLLTVLPVAPRQGAGAPPYTHVATLPSVIDGRALRTFAHDPVEERLYAASDEALYRVRVGTPEPRLGLPLFRKRIVKIELAPDLGRLFYFTPDELGYADVRSAEVSPVTLAAGVHVTDLAYEPTRQELYVSIQRQPEIRVYDAKSGERGPTLDVPGWFGYELEGTRGRVFLGVGGKDGIYSIDAATRRLAPWPVAGRISTPAYFEADPDGRYLFLSYYRELVAVDIASAAVIGRQIAAMQPAIAYDPAANLLVATWNDEPPPTRVVVYRPGADGLTVVARLTNPAIGHSGVEPMYRGFVQAGQNALLLWTPSPGGPGGQLR